jgi:hypothetical protein
VALVATCAGLTADSGTIEVLPTGDTRLAYQGGERRLLHGASSAPVSLTAHRGEGIGVIAGEPLRAFAERVAAWPTESGQRDGSDDPVVIEVTSGGLRGVDYIRGRRYEERVPSAFSDVRESVGTPVTRGCLLRMTQAFPDAGFLEMLAGVLGDHVRTPYFGLHLRGNAVFGWYGERPIW